MDYSSVEFLLAEAAERSLIGIPSGAAAHYNAAITASLAYYGVTTANISTYLAQPDVPMPQRKEPGNKK